MYLGKMMTFEIQKTSVLQTNKLGLCFIIIDDRRPKCARGGGAHQGHPSVEGVESVEPNGFALRVFALVHEEGGAREERCMVGLYVLFVVLFYLSLVHSAWV